MNIKTLLEKYKIDLKKSFSGLPDIREPWEAFAVSTYIKQREKFKSIPSKVAECLDREDPDEADNIYGRCFEPPFGSIETPVFSGSEADKLLALEDAVTRLPQTPGIMISEIAFNEEKHGLFAKKTYVCILHYEKRPFEGMEDAARKMAYAFRYRKRPDVEKELQYLRLCNPTDVQVLIQLSESSMLTRVRNEEYRRKATELLERKVSAGDLSVMGMYAKLIMFNSPKAAKRFAQMAADEGNADGMYVLGKLLEEGVEGEPDINKALEYYEKASGKGNADALYTLGKWHQNSNPSIRAKERAFNFFREAANLGHGPALYELGYAQEYAIGTKRNASDAFYCFKAAADLGILEGIYMLGVAYLNGSGTVKKVNEAFRYLKRAADLGHEKAQVQVARMYAEGIEGSSDWKKAFSYYIQAADNGDAEAQYWSGVYYDDGRGVARDKATAISYYMEAADQGNERALKKMSEIFMSHAGGEETRREAFEYLKKVAQDGSPIALSQLGRAYWIGNGTEENHETAYKYYKQAADKGYREAQYRVGMCLKNGDGTGKNLTQALAYFKMASELGHGQSTLEAQNVAKLLKLLKDENSLSSELILLKEVEDYEQIFKLLREYGISMSDRELLRDIFSGYVEHAIEENEGGVYTEQAILEFLLKMAAKGEELRNISPGESFYDAALQFEAEGRNMQALTAFVLSATCGCLKAMTTLSNMANEGSRYFISLDESYL